MRMCRIRPRLMILIQSGLLSSFLESRKTSPILFMISMHAHNNNPVAKPSRLYLLLKLNILCISNLFSLKLYKMENVSIESIFL